MLLLGAPVCICNPILVVAVSVFNPQSSTPWMETPPITWMFQLPTVDPITHLFHWISNRWDCWECTTLSKIISKRVWNHTNHHPHPQEKLKTRSWQKRLKVRHQIMRSPLTNIALWRNFISFKFCFDLEQQKNGVWILNAFILMLELIGCLIWRQVPLAL